MDKETQKKAWVLVIKYLKNSPDKNNTEIAKLIVEELDINPYFAETIRKKVASIRITPFSELSSSSLSKEGKDAKLLSHASKPSGEINNELNLQDAYDRELVKNVSTKKLKFRILFISDIHGVLVDTKAFAVVLQLLESREYDEVVLNGDINDFPRLSRHDEKLHQYQFPNYSEINEIEFTRKHILLEIKKRSKANIVARLGNHDERLITPLKNANVIQRVYDVQNHFKSTSYSKIIGLDDLQIENDMTTKRSYFGVYDVVHGLNQGQAGRKNNIIELGGSGCSGDSHRGGVEYFTNAKGTHSWMETGCLRHRLGVEYARTGKTPNWVQGFGECIFDLSKDDRITFQQNFYYIHNGVSLYEGKLIDVNL